MSGIWIQRSSCSNRNETGAADFIHTGVTLVRKCGLEIRDKIQSEQMQSETKSSPRKNPRIFFPTKYFSDNFFFSKKIFFRQNLFPIKKNFYQRYFSS